jgi:hypothetical protein
MPKFWGLLGLLTGQPGPGSPAALDEMRWHAAINHHSAFSRRTACDRRFFGCHKIFKGWWNHSGLPVLVQITNDVL